MTNGQKKLEGNAPLQEGHSTDSYFMHPCPLGHFPVLRSNADRVPAENQGPISLRSQKMETETHRELLEAD